MSRYTVTNISSISWKLIFLRYQYRWSLKSSENPRGLRTPTQVKCFEVIWSIKDFITRNVWKASSSCSLFDIFCWTFPKDAPWDWNMYLHLLRQFVFRYQVSTIYIAKHISLVSPSSAWFLTPKKILRPTMVMLPQSIGLRCFMAKKVRRGKLATEGPCHGNMPPETWHTPAWPHGRLWVLIWPLWRKGLPLVWLGLLCVFG